MDSLVQLGQYLLAGIAFLIVITVLVAVHELGHYWAAKAFGMKVDAFAVMMGGIRSTDLRDRLPGPLAPAWSVAVTAVAAVAMVAVGGLEGYPIVQTLGLFLLAIALPVWVATRIGALYGFSIGRTLKPLGGSWLAGLAFLLIATGLKNVDTIQALTVLFFASSVGVLLLYYQPVLHKPEDSPMGEGELDMDGERVAVRFRPLLSRRAKDGTEFSLLLLPLGGFAAIRGMHPKPDGSETQIEAGFYSKSPFARWIVLFAGPLFSVLFGLILYTLLFVTLGEERPLDRPVIGTIREGAPAAKGGLKPGDRIISVDGKPVSTFYDMLVIVRERADKPLQFVYERAGQQSSTTIIPKADESPSPVISPKLEPTEERRIQGKIGAGWGSERVALTLPEAMARAWQAPVRMVEGFVGLIKNPSRAKDEVGGAATLATVTYHALEEGLGVLLGLAAGLSISLGIMNLLPVPPLDGGQMVVAFVEMLRRGRRLSIEVQQMVSTVGMVLVLALVIGVLAVDMNRFLGKPTASPSSSGSSNAAPPPGK